MVEKISRNAPCPCGSGKKYKNCCWQKEMNDTASLLRNKVVRLEMNIAGRLIEFIEHNLEEDTIAAAWDEFLLLRSEDISSSEEAPHEDVFWPWLFYDYIYEDRSGEQMNTISILYRKRNQNKIPADELRLMLANENTAFSFYEVMAVTKGKDMILRDLLLDREFIVKEKNDHPEDLVGYLIYAKIIQFEEITLISGAGMLYFPPDLKSEIMALRKAIAGRRKKLQIEHLWEREADLRNLYFELYELITMPPQLQNTDGEALIFQSIRYRVPSAQTAFDVLKSLAAGVPEEELLENAVYNEQGVLVKIEFPWLKKTDSKNNPLQRSVLGFIQIRDTELTVDVNSANRAFRIRREISKRLGKNAEYLETKTTDFPEPANSPEESYDPDEALNIRPEITEAVDQMMKDHWSNWVDEKIPALDDMTPKQANKTEAGREKLSALLDHLDRLDEQQKQLPSQKKYINQLRRKFGMERKS